MLPSSYRQTIRQIHSSLRDESIDWAITGSAALAIHGIDVQVGDIDIQSDESGIYVIEKLFANDIVRAVHFSSSDQFQSHFGELCIGGIPVELMGALQKRLANGQWESPVSVVEHRVFATLDSQRLPLMSLNYLHDAYDILDRQEKVRQIQYWLASCGTEDIRQQTDEP